MKKRFSIALIIASFFVSISANGPFVPDGDELSIYPNPATTNLTIKFETESTEIAHVKIIDLTGKIVKDFSKDLVLENGIYKGQLDIETLKPGIYFVRVEQQDTVFSKKLIIK